jgi:hypothetical protein
MHETEIRVPTADGEMTTFVAHPAGEEPYPVSLLYMSPDAVMRDTRAILDTIAADPAASPGPKVCVGYRMSLRLAATFADEVAAAAGIHPGALITGQADSPHRDVASVTGELYSAFAENDQSATPEVVQRFDDELEDRGVPGVVERLPGTSHASRWPTFPSTTRPPPSTTSNARPSSGVATSRKGGDAGVVAVGDTAASTFAPAPLLCRPFWLGWRRGRFTPDQGSPGPGIPPRSVYPAETSGGSGKRPAQRVRGCGTIRTCPTGRVDDGHERPATSHRSTCAASGHVACEGDGRPETGV